MAPDAPLWTRATRNPQVDDRSSTGRMEIFLPRPDVVIGRVTGHFSTEMGKRWTAHAAGAIAVSRVMCFCDWERMTSYDSGARRELTNFLLANLRGYQSAHILIGSKMVAMGVAAASLSAAIVGFKLASYTNRATFESTLAPFV